MNQQTGEKCVEKIPDTATIRIELAKNQRERSLLQKLLRVAERKAAFTRLNAEADREVSNV